MCIRDRRQIAPRDAGPEFRSSDLFSVGCHGVIGFLEGVLGGLVFLGPLVLQSAVGSWAMFGGDGIIFGE